MLDAKHFHRLAVIAFDLGSAESTVSPLKQRIRDCMDRETIVVEALKALKSKGPRKLANGVLKWEEADGLLYYRSKLYVSNNNEFCGEVVKSCYDTATTGHPGKHGTLELVSHHY